jgi:hypothetical protein
MSFLFNLIKWLILSPFKLLKLLVIDLLFHGIIGGTFTVLKAVLKFFFKPLLLAIMAGGALVFILSDQEKRNKVKALIGM